MRFRTFKVVDGETAGMSSVRVFLRSRPLVASETAQECASCLRFVDDRQVVLGKDRAFTFDKSLDGSSTQQQIYEAADALRDLIQLAIRAEPD